VKNEILDAKTKNRYEIVRGFFGGLKLKKTYDWKTSNIGMFGTQGIIFDEEHTNTELRTQKVSKVPQALQPKKILVSSKQREDEQ